MLPLQPAYDISAYNLSPRNIEPECRGQFGIDENVSLFTFAKLGAIGLGDERNSESVGLIFVAQHLSDERGTGGDVAPLVCSSKLDLAAQGFV